MVLVVPKAKVAPANLASVKKSPRFIASLPHTSSLIFNSFHFSHWHSIQLFFSYCFSARLHAMGLLNSFRTPALTLRLRKSVNFSSFEPSFDELLTNFCNNHQLGLIFPILWSYFHLLYDLPPDPTSRALIRNPNTIQKSTPMIHFL